MTEALLRAIEMDPISAKDLALGFLAALALRRGRIKMILDKVLPDQDNDGQ